MAVNLFVLLSVTVFILVIIIVFGTFGPIWLLEIQERIIGKTEPSSLDRSHQYRTVFDIENDSPRGRYGKIVQQMQKIINNPAISPNEMWGILNHAIGQVDEFLRIGQQGYALEVLHGVYFFSENYLSYILEGADVEFHDEIRNTFNKSNEKFVKLQLASLQIQYDQIIKRASCVTTWDQFEALSKSKTQVQDQLRDLSEVLYRINCAENIDHVTQQIYELDEKVEETREFVKFLRIFESYSTYYQRVIENQQEGRLSEASTFFEKCNDFNAQYQEIRTLRYRTPQIERLVEKYQILNSQITDFRRTTIL